MQAKPTTLIPSEPVADSFDQNVKREYPFARSALEGLPCIGYGASSLPGFFVWEKLEADVRVDDRMKLSIVFIGRQGEHFISLGTGFLAVKNTGGKLFQQIVTARHVIEDFKEGEPVYVRVNRRGSGVEVLPTNPGHWITHPDDAVDLAVCPTSIPPDQFEIMHIHLDDDLATEDVVSNEQIGIGDDVFVAGMFTRHLGEARNLPIVRSGVISAMPEEKVWTQRGYADAYLIEVRSIAGLSGSPVFVHMAPYRVLPGGVVRKSEHKTHYFIGVMQGHFVTQDPTDVISEDDASPGDMATGIGLVVPAQKLAELIDLPELREKREAIVEQKKRESGVVLDSAAGQVSPTKHDKS